MAGHQYIYISGSNVRIKKRKQEYGPDQEQENMFHMFLCLLTAAETHTLI
jgi:hypothetical protein